jgi:N-acetyltransferase
MRSAFGDYEIDDDPARVDVAAAISFLTSEAYWGRWRTGEDISRQIAAAWRVVGAYDRSEAMVGFARASGDGGAAYLADVYVLRGHRGAGLGKAIVRAMIDDGPGAGWRWMLHTSDAHGLYRSFGFTRPNGRYMERAPQGPRGDGGDGGAGSPAVRGGIPGGRAPGEIQPPLIGKLIRLEPLEHRHVPGLVAASEGGADLYRWSPVPQDEAQAREYVETALAAADLGQAVPFAAVRTEDDVVIGSTRFFDLQHWPWPDAQARPAGPDTCEIGYTWLGPKSIRTGANTEMKRLMLTHAFEAWQVRSVCLHTDARNQRSRDAMARIGARYEGTLSAHRLGADLTPRDSARFAITAAEWPAVRQHLEKLSRRYQPT